MIRNDVPLLLLGGYLTGVVVTLLGVTYVDRQEPSVSSGQTVAGEWHLSCVVESEPERAMEVEP